MAGEAKLDPMHQFTIEPLVPLHIGGVDVSLTNSSAWMLITLALIFLFVLLGHEKGTRPGPLADGRRRADELRRQHAPGEYRTGGEALLPSHLLAVHLYPCVQPARPAPDRHHSRPASLHYDKPIQHHGRSRRPELLDGPDRRLLAARAAILSLFVPHGTPAPMVPLIAAIEFISFMVRPFSLALRLFVAMIAGHILMEVFASFIVGGSGAMGLGVGVLSFLFIIFVVALELLMCAIQAYVFALLTTLYLDRRRSFALIDMPQINQLSTVFNSQLFWLLVVLGSSTS